jgi:hypothetical protein
LLPPIMARRRCGRSVHQEGPAFCVHYIADCAIL